jgi:hypothetical protein
VAKVIVSAIESSRPRPRYLVGVTSRALVWTHQVLPTGAWDAVMRRTYPTP